MKTPKEFELVQVHENNNNAEVIIRDKYSCLAYGGILIKNNNPESVYSPNYFKEEPIIIYEEPLSDEEFKQHNIEGKIRESPIRYHLIDVIKMLKFGRPNTEIMDEWIAMMELMPERGSPFSSNIVNGVWDNKE